MKELTRSQMNRQDDVDNAIHQLIQGLCDGANPKHRTLDWDISVIAEVRETIQEHLEQFGITEMQFYPYLEEEAEDPKIREYISSPVHCPNCQSQNIEGGSVEIDEGTATQDIRCLDCDSSWTDHYTISHISNLEGGEENKKNTESLPKQKE